jgi:hypothetical protein
MLTTALTTLFQPHRTRSLCMSLNGQRNSDMSSDDSSLILVKRSRRAAPRVKTGCSTCKYVNLLYWHETVLSPANSCATRTRRVKCGEEEPSCLKCTKSGHKCPGYAPTSTKAQFGAFAISQGNGPPSGISIHQNLGDNIQYLEFYHHCAVPTISTPFDKDFWARTPLQIAQSEQCVRHALIALSYLNKYEPGTLKHARSSLLAPAKQDTLLTYYNKSVKLLVQRMSEPSYTHEVGLVCCLLFVCIESLRGNYDTAMAHYR